MLINQENNEISEKRRRKSNPARRWLTIRETAEYLGISVKGCYDIAASGKLPAARVGRLVRIDLWQLEADLERQSQGGMVVVRMRGRTKRGWIPGASRGDSLDRG